MTGGGSKICEKMVKDGVMTPLVVLLRDKYEGWDPSATSKKKSASEKKEKIDSPRETFIQAVALLRNLWYLNHIYLKHSH